MGIPLAVRTGQDNEQRFRSHGAPSDGGPSMIDTANAFFRAGEIETWGRGIKRIFKACDNDGTPEPKKAR